MPVANTPAPDDMMTASEARDVLGVTKSRMAAFLASGAITVTPDPTDKRRKLLRREDVERYAKMLPRERAPRRSRGEAWKLAHPIPPSSYRRDAKARQSA